MALRSDIYKLVESIPLADTHEHIVEEKNRLSAGDRHLLDDIGVLFSCYSEADLRVAGMSEADLDTLLKRGVSRKDKWEILKPYYKACRNTGYLQAVRITVRKLYGEDDITDETVGRIDEKIKETIKPGFTRRIIKDVANIDHCQVHSLEVRPFCETDHPDFLLQDINLATLVGDWKWPHLQSLTGVTVRNLDDYHRVVDSIFDKYGGAAVAVKSNQAYGRKLDYEDVKAEEIASVFERDAGGTDPANGTEQKAIQDHLFHYCVERATEHGLPVKLHTGYYSGVNRMPLHRLRHNAGDVCELLRIHPSTPFVIMHITYPYQSELIAVTKQYTNAYADMCWAWIINPVASVRFLKELLMAAPVNKILTFGGDYRSVETVVGHAEIARRGIAQALAELVEEGWMDDGDVEYVANRIMRDNARELFKVKEKFGV